MNTWVERNLVRGRRAIDRVGIGSLRRNFLTALPFWVASVITGLIAVGFTKLFGIAETLFGVIRSWHPWMIFLITPTCFVIAFLTVKQFAPFASGSGIPQVMAAIDVSNKRQSFVIDRLLNIRIIFTKILSSILMVLGGGPVGREGPTIQIAGSVFRVMDKMIPKSWPKLSSQSFILTGAAAGLAAAFNTPLGGIVFAMEELSKIHVRFFRTALFSAVIISGLTAQELLGSYLYLGYPTVSGSGFTIYFAVIFVAILSGWGGGLMCKAIIRIRRWKKNFSMSKRLLFAAGSGLVIAAIAFFLNDAIFGSGKELINQLLFGSDKSAKIDTVFYRVLGPILCFNTGASGGVFAPALAAGASLGAHLAQLFDYTSGNANILILAGMVGFLTGVTRTPFTSAILVLEMTDRHGVIFHLMLASMVANLAAFTVDKHSFYEQLKEEFKPAVNVAESKAT